MTTEDTVYETTEPPVPKGSLVKVYGQSNSLVGELVGWRYGPWELGIIDSPYCWVATVVAPDGRLFECRAAENSTIKIEKISKQRYFLEILKTPSGIEECEL